MKLNYKFNPTTKPLLLFANNQHYTTTKYTKEKAYNSNILLSQPCKRPLFIIYYNSGNKKWGLSLPTEINKHLTSVKWLKIETSEIDGFIFNKPIWFINPESALQYAHNIYAELDLSKLNYEINEIGELTWYRKTPNQKPIKTPKYDKITETVYFAENPFFTL